MIIEEPDDFVLGGPQRGPDLFIGGVQASAPEEPVKWCPKCDPPRFKPISQFFHFRRSADGLSPYCKVCMTAYNMRYRATARGAFIQEAASKASRVRNKTTLFKDMRSATLEEAEKALALFGFDPSGRPLKKS